MIIIQIFGWIFLVLLSIALIMCLCLNWKDMWRSIKDFFYCLFTWQKKVPVYRDIGNNQFSNLFAAMFPVHHYEWVKMKTPIQWFKEKFNRRNHH